ncbi:hypothetical protein [Inconstantimicrobium mannanitabidum]|uniref:Uncharacterized protein n=1 Tax=Inconstantimicrobium mannanitabidum TaxID=1604901 RepID=A0ACB5RIG0_9CLOT|nr:hypothetical protein [Clostridium sp. TW13]GKX68880.1 hypothetical protein rsdtw13_41380 [Clostridium sp. TW13]
MKEFFSMTILSYLLYILNILYCLVPMAVQVIVAFLIEKKKIFKIAIMVFLTEGFVVPIALMIYDIFNSLHNYSATLGISHVVISQSFKFNILYSLVMFIVLIVIGFFSYKNIYGKMNLSRSVQPLSPT